MFSKPRYFYEETEDFKPFDMGQKQRDSPKRFTYKPMNYPNFVMNRKPAQKLQNFAPMNGGDGNQNAGNYVRGTKKGSYNFHRIFNNDQNGFKSDPNDFVEIVRGNGDGYVRSNETEIFDSHETGTEQNIPNMNYENKDEAGRVDDDEKMTEKKKSDKSENVSQFKKDEYQKHDKPKKKAKAEAATANKEPEEVDEDGFTRVKYRGHNTSKKQKSAENVPWIVPGQEKK